MAVDTINQNIMYTQVSLINDLSVSKNDDVIFLLGAGCSASSGCLMAKELVDEFRKRIYCANHGVRYEKNLLINEANFMNAVNEECPPDIPNAYSVYFEKCFQTPQTRNDFIKQEFQTVLPSYGYLCFANYLIKNGIKNVLTTNFDKLVEKSILRLEPSYDLVSESETVTPKTDCALKITKLHGDYNYDNLKNTSDELQSLSNKLFEIIKNLRCKKIVVIGYSGYDLSVMNSLQKIMNDEIIIQWCVVQESFPKNDLIDKLFDRNPNSGYCLINSFDDLFSKLYMFQGADNGIINNEYKNIVNNNFNLEIINQPEDIRINANVLKNDPSCYVVNGLSIREDLVNDFNISNDKSYLIKHKNSLYGIGDRKQLSNFLNICSNDIATTSILKIRCPIFIKCKLIKEGIKIACIRKGLSVYKNCVYKPRNEDIQIGLDLNIDLFDGKICLFTNVNYFCLEEEKQNDLKLNINKIKSSMYANLVFAQKNNLVKTLFNGNLSFEVCDSKFLFENNNLEDIKNIYNCAFEPSMSIGNQCSVNQIQLLNTFGPLHIKFSPDDVKVAVFCPYEHMLKLSKFLSKLVNGTNVAKKGIIPTYKGFKNIFSKTLFIDYNVLPKFTLKQLLANKGDFRNFIMRGIKRFLKGYDILLIYIPNELKALRNFDNVDLHDFIKLNCANLIKTQFLEEETLDSSDDENKKIFNLAMGIYTKSIGIPWRPKNYKNDTIFIGMSFGVNSKGVTVGCSQIFDGSGQGMKFIVSEISDKKRKNQYLSKEEAYNLGLQIRTTYYKCNNLYLLKRIVIHRNSYFREEEIAGFKKAFEGVKFFDLIQITEFTKFNGFVVTGDSINGFPVKRGTTIKSSKDSVYLWTDGSVKSFEINKGFVYRNNSRGMGSPLKITKCYGEASINTIVDEIMMLTKMDFNSSDAIYSKLPVTIKYAQVICRLLKQGNLESKSINFQYVM